MNYWRSPDSVIYILVQILPSSLSVLEAESNDLMSPTPIALDDSLSLSRPTNMMVSGALKSSATVKWVVCTFKDGLRAL